MAINNVFSTNSLSGNIVFGNNTNFPIDYIYDHTTTLLQDGRLLIIAGRHSAPPDYFNIVSNSCYLGTMNNGVLSWVQINDFPITVNQHSSVLLSDGRVLVVGGWDQYNALNSTYIGTISGNTISWVQSNNFPTYISLKSLILLSDGRVVTFEPENVSPDMSYFMTISGDTIAYQQLIVSPDYIVYPRYAIQLNYTRILAVSNFLGVDYIHKIYIGTISGSSITWVYAGDYPSVPGAIGSLTLLPNGKVFSKEDGSVNTYIGTVSGNTVSWVPNDNFPYGYQDNTMTILPVSIPVKPDEITLSFSSDGGVSFSNNKTISLGAQGERKKRIIWRRLGRHRNLTLKVTTRCTSQVNIIAAHAELS